MQPLDLLMTDLLCTISTWWYNALFVPAFNGLNIDTLVVLKEVIKKTWPPFCLTSWRLFVPSSVLTVRVLLDFPALETAPRTYPWNSNVVLKKRLCCVQDQTQLRSLYKILRFDGWVLKSTHLTATHDKPSGVSSLLIKSAAYQSRVICLFSPCFQRLESSHPESSWEDCSPTDS